MRKSYIQIMKQIEALQAEAAKLKKVEVDGVKDRIREAIAFYGLSAADLGISGGRTAPANGKKATRKTRKSGQLSQAAKYRDAVSGGSWVGRGKRPQWLRDALAGGKSLEDYLVK